MGHRAVNQRRGLGWVVCAAAFAALFSTPLAAQPAPSAKFPSEPAEAASAAHPPQSGNVPPSTQRNATYPVPPSYSEPGSYLAARGPQLQEAPAPAASASARNPDAAAAATPPRADEHPRPDAGWSLGAGIVFQDSFGSLGSFATPNGINPASPLTPSYRLAAERRLGRNTWLALNAAFSYSHSEQPISFTSATSPHTRDTLDLEAAQEALLLGIRQVVARGVVDLSMYVAVGGAHSKTRGDVPAPGEVVAVIPGGRGNTLGAVAGIAVERELIDALALRLSADIVGVSLTKQSEEKVDSSTGEQTTTERSSQSAGLTLRPGIQIQFYF